MNVGSPFSVIGRNPETSALPEAVWYQESTSTASSNFYYSNAHHEQNADAEGQQHPSGFFVSLLPRWDIAQDDSRAKSVFYQVTPFSDFLNNNNKDKKSHLFRLRLPRRLAVVDEEEEIIITTAISNDESMDAPPPLPSSPRHQERRIPLLVRFTDNHKLLAMQFSPFMVRIAVAIPIGHDKTTTRSSAPDAATQHWTVALPYSTSLDNSTTIIKDPYTPLPSSPDAMPQRKKKKKKKKGHTTTTTSSSNHHNETILPGGLFWLDQSYGNARGSDYQEFWLVLVTSRSLLCYTVTYNRLDEYRRQPLLSIELAHQFSHPTATAAWWASPMVLVVGSSTANADLSLRTYLFGGNGPFTSHREVLQNPLILPLRLERPPPVRCDAFTVGGGNGNNRQESTHKRVSSSSSSSPTSPSNDTNHSTIISVVQLYNKTYIVHVPAESVLVAYNVHAIPITLHQVDTENCVILQQQVQRQVRLPKRISRKSKVEEHVLITTLDNVLVITFRRSKFHVMVDILDSTKDVVVEKIMAQEEEVLAVPSDSAAPTPALFIAPNFLFLTQQGTVLPLSLDLERLAPSVIKHERCNFTMLLRRRHFFQQSSSSSTGRQTAMAHFSAIGALERPEQRLKWINHVAEVYCRQQQQRHHQNTTATPYQWDVVASVDLMFQCALLGRSGWEFLSSTDVIDFDDEYKLLRRMQRYSQAPSHPVLFQTELLEQLFLPKVQKVLRKKRQAARLANEDGNNNTQLVLHIAELAMSYVGALERHGSRACPAMQLFVFALLWRLGDAQVLMALLKAWKTPSQQKSSHPTSFLATQRHAFLLMDVVQHVEFGSLASKIFALNDQYAVVATLRKRTLQLSMGMLSASPTMDYRYPSCLISLLLQHSQLHEALVAASELLDSFHSHQQTSFKTRRKIAALIYARKCNGGDNFLNVANALWNCDLEATTSDRCAMLQSMFSFLSKWDPRRVATISKGRGFKTSDDIFELMEGSEARTKFLSRRPSCSALAGKTNTAAPAARHTPSPFPRGIALDKVVLSKDLTSFWSYFGQVFGVP
ncbi:expressed unknown protein [Seminavis robusta]|uniref:Mic1 domain-containing protein n=1 Tax=Seminavis robusta TaxID=568900 RepID=A0A9N8H8X3_9STRA|nr:expressed unknown protein [Seminavis robusta]|eukprot:Sro234_g094450.1 n/a (1049) ;mRNA; f:44268-47582